MKNIVKAKVIVELLDERKYSILSSLSSTELNQLNSVNIEELDQLSASDINTTLNDFLNNVDKKIAEKKDDPQLDVPVKDVPKMKPKKEKKTKVSSPSIADRLSEQPPQLIACLLNKVNDDQKQQILSNLSKDQKTLIETIQVDNNPIFDQVVGSILEGLELTDA